MSINPGKVALTREKEVIDYCFSTIVYLYCHYSIVLFKFCEYIGLLLS